MLEGLHFTAVPLCQEFQKSFISSLCAWPVQGPPDLESLFEAAGVPGLSQKNSINSKKSNSSNNGNDSNSSSNSKNSRNNTTSSNSNNSNTNNNGKNSKNSNNGNNSHNSSNSSNIFLVLLFGRGTGQQVPDKLTNGEPPFSPEWYAGAKERPSNMSRCQY